MKERGPESDPYWQHDFSVELPPGWGRPDFGVRFKAHESSERFHQGARDELIPLTVTRGTRLYFHGKPYRLERDYRLTLALHPVPRPTGEVGVVQDSSWEGLRQTDIGQAQAWYYPEDATLVLWECFLEGHLRKAAPHDDALHTAVWQSWERWLLGRSPDAARIVTTWEDIYDRPIWQDFLAGQGYESVAPAAFAKEVATR